MQNQANVPMFKLALRIVAACLAFYGASADAQNFPNRPIRLIVPFAPGGSADTLGRSFSQNVSNILGEQIVVENRPGAGGVLGAAQVVRSKPDGYTLLVSGVATHAIAPAINAAVDYDPVSDFTQIAYMGGPPVVLVVHPSLGVKTFGQFVEKLRESGQSQPFGSPGQGTQGHLIGEYLGKKLGLKLDHVAYKGAGLAMLDVIAGHIKVGTLTWASALGHIKAGEVIPLAVSSKKRMPDAPDVPTFTELGLPDVVATTWFSISGPKGMPSDIASRLNDAYVKSLEAPEVQSLIKREGIEVEPMNVSEFTKFVEQERGRWALFASTAGIGKSPKN